MVIYLAKARFTFAKFLYAQKRKKKPLFRGARQSSTSFLHRSYYLTIKRRIILNDNTGLAVNARLTSQLEIFDRRTTKTEVASDRSKNREYKTDNPFNFTFCLCIHFYQKLKHHHYKANPSQKEKETSKSYYPDEEQNNIEVDYHIRYPSAEVLSFDSDVETESHRAISSRNFLIYAKREGTRATPSAMAAISTKS